VYASNTGLVFTFRCAMVKLIMLWMGVYCNVLVRKKT